MDALDFLNGMFQYAALNNFSRWVEREFPWTDMEELPIEGLDAFDDANHAGENPTLARHPDHGWFVIHDFRADTESRFMRMVCWAEIGPAKYSQIATDWWKLNNPAGGPGSLLEQVGVNGDGWRAE